MKTVLTHLLTVLFITICCQCHRELDAPDSNNDEERQKRSQPTPAPIPVPLLQPEVSNSLIGLDENELLAVANGNRNGENSVKGAEAMHRFLNVWNPVGRSGAELEKVFGKPNRPYGTFGYYFDTGNFGRVIEFHFENGKVKSWEHRGY